MPPFVVGWREVFVPLVVVLHNQHGPLLAVAGLAIAASRLGGWLYARGLFRRPPHEAAVLGGIALLLLGLAPEEGPIGLLLWFVFGATWPILHEALAGRTWPGLAGAAVLLVAMASAGPLAAGPGTWLIAACFFLLAWRLGPKAAKAPIEATAPARSVQLDDSTWLAAVPFLFSVTGLAWIWLVPARLIDLGVAPVWYGVAVAVSWAARFAGAWIAMRLAGVRRQAMSALGLVLGLLVVALAPEAWQLAAGLVLFGVGIGIAGAHPVVERPELARLPGRAQALGEVLGPLAGVMIYIFGGVLAVFAFSALVAIVLAILCARQGPFAKPQSLP